jgi:hypothetical protein
MRYSLQMPRTEKYNHQGSFLPGLANSYSLPQPVTLPVTGQMIKSAHVPPFALDGYGGRTRGLWPTDYRAFEPRFGFAWSAKMSRTKSKGARHRRTQGKSKWWRDSDEKHCQADRNAGEAISAAPPNRKRAEAP